MRGDIFPSTVSQIPAQRRRSAVGATVLGNALEWFDFTLFGFFAPVIAKLFFPANGELTSLLFAVATFGVGFAMRPVGGIVLGIYADKYGRKPALSLTVLLMAIGTAMIGFSPTYAQIGVWAPVIIVIARLLQGFSAGGEMGSATAFLVESAPATARAYQSSWIQAGIGFAVLLGAALGAAVTSGLSAQALDSWGWRIPFLLGLLIGPVGYLIRSRMSETAAFAAIAANAKTQSPLAQVVKHFPRETLAGFSLVVLWTVSTYVLLFYMPTYSLYVLHLPKSTGFIAGMAGGVMVMVCAPVVGKFADRYGRRGPLTAAALLMFALAYPMFAFINHVPGLLSMLCFQVVFGALIALYTGPILAALSELFPTRVLSTGLSLAYNLAVMLFGGFAPLFMTWMINTTGDSMAPALYVMAAALVSLMGTFHVREMGHVERPAIHGMSYGKLQ